VILEYASGTDGPSDAEDATLDAVELWRRLRGGEPWLWCSSPESTSYLVRLFSVRG